MALLRTIGILTIAGAAGVVVSAQTPAGPAFDVVSVKRNTSEALGSNVTRRPDGGFSILNTPVAVLISQAYLPAIPLDMVDRPPWTMNERYDVRATSLIPNPTLGQRTAMLRALLADRFGLVVHVETHDEPDFELVFARSDRRLGPGLQPVDVDCDSVLADRAAAPPSSFVPPQTAEPLPPCFFRSMGAPLRDRFGDHQGRLGDLLEGEGTLASLAGFLRVWTGRIVVNKTGLTGSYRVTMNYDASLSRRRPDAVVAPDAPPSIFDAVQEQLGLKLDAARDQGSVLVIDRIAHPTED